MKMASETMLFQSKLTLDTESVAGESDVVFAGDLPSHNEVNVGLHARSTPACVTS